MEIYKPCCVKGCGATTARVVCEKCAKVGGYNFKYVIFDELVEPLKKLNWIQKLAKRMFKL